MFWPHPSVHLSGAHHFSPHASTLSTLIARSLHEFSKGRNLVWKQHLLGVRGDAPGVFPDMPAISSSGMARSSPAGWAQGLRLMSQQPVGPLTVVGGTIYDKDLSTIFYLCCTEPQRNNTNFLHVKYHGQVSGRESQVTPPWGRWSRELDGSLLYRPRPGSGHQWQVSHPRKSFLGIHWKKATKSVIFIRVPLVWKLATNAFWESNAC